MANARRTLKRKAHAPTQKIRIEKREETPLADAVVAIAKAVTSDSIEEAGKKNPAGLQPSGFRHELDGKPNVRSEENILQFAPALMWRSLWKPAREGRQKNDPIRSRRRFQGIPVAIEWPAGTTRQYADSDFTRKMSCDYGYISGTKGEDGEELDVYVGENEDAAHAYVIAQLVGDYEIQNKGAKPGAFDEWKVMLGFDDEASAKSSFIKHLSEKQFGGILEVTMDEFKEHVLPRLGNTQKTVVKMEAGMPVAGLTTEELCLAHDQIHIAKSMLEEDRVNLHARIVDELYKRDVNHPPPPNDSLDDRSEDFERYVVAQKSARQDEREIDPPAIVAVKDSLAEIEKRSPKPFRSPGGKDVWVPTLKAMMPPHKLYIEPYAGSASLFFGKEPSEKEVLVELNADICALFQFLKTASDSDLAWMRSQYWKWSPSNFDRMKSSNPTDLRRKAYRYKYLNLFSVRGACEYLDKTDVVRANTGKVFLNNLEKFRDRLKSATIVQGDAIAAMKKYDGPDTFHYVDPPWKALARNSEWTDFDATKFIETIKALKGKVLISYQGDIGELPGYHKKSVTRAQGGIAGLSKQELYWNYEGVSNSVFKSIDEIEKAAGIEGPHTCEFCSATATKATLHVEGKVFIPTCEEHLAKAKERIVDSGDEVSGVKPIAVKSDPYLVKSEAPVRFALHRQFNGTESQSVLRIASGEEAIAWAIDMRLSAAAPVVSVEKALEVAPDPWPTKRANAIPIGVHPIAWLDVEGISKSLGASEELPGVFAIADRGVAEFGEQRADRHEYHLHGRAGSRRVVFRKIAPAPVAPSAGECMACEKDQAELGVRWAGGRAKVLLCKSCHPDWIGGLMAKAEAGELPAVTATVAADVAFLAPEPGVVVAKGLAADGAAEGHWVAMVGESDRAPIRKAASMTDGAFALQRVRWIDGMRVWPLHLDLGTHVVTCKMAEDPLDGAPVIAELVKSLDAEVLDLEGPLPSASCFNPRRGSHGDVKRVDVGKASVIANDDEFVRVVLKGEKLDGTFDLIRQDDVWLFKRSGEAIDGAESFATKFEVSIQKMDVEKQLVTGIVLEPDEIDAHKDTVKEETIERAAHRFLARYNQATKMGYMHSMFGSIGVELVQSWIAHEPTVINGKPVKKGSWLMTVKVTSKQLWERIKRGEITGFSIGGIATVS